MSRAQPRRGDGEALRKHFSFVLDLGCLRRVPRKNREADTPKGAHRVCFIRWRSWGASDRTKGREKEEVGGLGADSCGHLISVLDPLTLLMLESHFISPEGKGRNIPSS